MPLRVVAIVVYATLMIMGCVQNQKPLTEEDRCTILCQGNDSNHPCLGEEAADDCVSSCATHIAPLVDDCLTCVLTHSGWIGEACVCQDVDEFGMVNVTCKACSYTTHETDCADSTVCTKDSETCTGFTLVEPTDTACAPACGG